MSDPDNQELFQYYNERAPEYEAFYAGEFPTGPRSPALYKADTRAIQRLLPHYVKGKCLDIACGTGFWLPYYHAGCSTITLIDQSEGVLAECLKKIETLGIKEKTNVIRGNVFKDIPLNHRYDSAIAGFLVSHFKDEEPVNFLSILKKALKPGGRFIIIDSVWGPEAKTHHRDQNSMALRHLYDGRTFNIYKRYFTKDELGILAAANGFRLETVYWGDVFFLAVGQFKVSGE